MWRELRRGGLRRLASRLRRGEVSAREVVHAQLQAMAAAQPALNAFTWRLAESELPAVPDRPPPPGAGPVWGVGGAVKANLWVRGRETACGSRVLRGWRAPDDAVAVARLRAAGAIPVAGTVMDEFGMGSSGEHAAEGPVRNPWAIDRTPGGSSAGAAAAVAAGLAWWALGTDTGGSVRQPAHCCGLVGLKPTYGRVSRRGLVAYVSSCDQVGVLGREVADVAAVYAAIAGHDPGDATSLATPVGDPAAACTRPARGLRVGVVRDLLDTAIAPAVLVEFEDALATLTDLGVEVRDVALPDVRRSLAVYYVIACAEAATNLARYDGSLYGARRPGATYGEMATATRTAGLGTEVKRRILLGTHVLSAGHRARTYERALVARRAIAAAFAATLAGVDALALPTAPEPAFRLGERRDDPVRMMAGDLLTVPASLAGLPAVTLPTGLDAGGLPLSLQLIGRPSGEDTLLALAAAVEAARGFPRRPEAPWNR